MRFPPRSSGPLPLQRQCGSVPAGWSVRLDRRPDRANGTRSVRARRWQLSPCTILPTTAWFGGVDGDSASDRDIGLIDPPDGSLLDHDTALLSEVRPVNVCGVEDVCPDQESDHRRR